LLGAENIGVSRASAGPVSADGKFDGIRRVEKDEIGNPRFLNTVKRSYRFPRQHLGCLNFIVGGVVEKDDVKGNPVNSRIFRAYGFGQGTEFNGFQWVPPY
jgi:hypothetical protein